MEAAAAFGPRVPGWPAGARVETTLRHEFA